MARGGVLNFELGTDVRPGVSTTNHITKPEKMQICNLYLNHLFLEGPFFKQISTFYNVNWDAFKYFLTTYRQTKGKIRRKLSILQKPDLYLNQFSNKKGAIGKPEQPKKHPIWAAHPCTHLSTKYPPPGGSGPIWVPLKSKACTGVNDNDSNCELQSPTFLFIHRPMKFKGPFTQFHRKDIPVYNRVL